MLSSDVPSVRTLHGCSLSNNQYAFNVLPGAGWDNLANNELGQVLKISYKQCHSSNDGAFLIPDNSIITPIKKSIVELNSDLFEHFSNYTSLTSKSINVDAHFSTPTYKISGSFSWEKKDIKMDQLREKSSVSRSQLRYELFNIEFQPDSQLDDKFRDRILDIGALLKDGNDSIYPKYLADLLVRDFGTHVIRSADAGAILSKTDILKSKYIENFSGDKTDLTAVASYSMSKTLGINIVSNYNQDNEKLDEFNNNCASTEINTIGGQPFGSNFTLDEWEKSFERDLVTVDRRGDPLFNFITTRSIPELEDKIVHQISKLVKDAVNRYYVANTRIGCMDIDSPNFNEHANVDSGICKDVKLNYNFGGIFQTCTGETLFCDDKAEKHLANNEFTCPFGYNAIQLHSGPYKCGHICLKKYLFIKPKCTPICADYALYWCAPTVSMEHSDGLLFGGLFTGTAPNPLTNLYTCPENYLAYSFGTTAKICIRQNNGVDLENSLSFGGFYSCQVGNPLATSSNLTDSKYWPKTCSSGYSAQVAVVDGGCEIWVCLKANQLKRRYREQPPLRRPPFIALEFGPNVTSVPQFKSHLGYTFTMNKHGEWNKSPLPNYGIVLISVFGSLLFCFLCIGIVFKMRKCQGIEKLQILSDEDNFGFQKIEDN